MKSHPVWLSALLLTWLCFQQLTFPQSQITTGTIQGDILDSSGAGVPNAKVSLQNVATGVERTTTTDGQGRFSAPLLQVGSYQITVNAPGFSTLVRKGYTLALSQTLQADLTLAPASLQETVTVTGDAPLVEATRTETTALVDQRAVESLPLNGRRFLDLAALTPGVSQDPERGGISFAGQRGINSNLNIDGADYNQPFFGGVRGGERSDKTYTISQ